jgi:uncharacterized membrane protein
LPRPYVQRAAFRVVDVGEDALCATSIRVTDLVLSFMSGTMHPYCTVALAPGITALVGTGLTAQGTCCAVIFSVPRTLNSRSFSAASLPRAAV